jgi:hypothetical protein
MMTFKKSYTRKALWLYIPLWLYFLYLFVQLLAYDGLHISHITLSIIDFIGFGVHEASHLICILLPNIFAASAGTVGELALPILIIIAALKSRSYFAAIFGGLWCMMTLKDIGTYMADARAQVLPTMGPSPEAKHDWNFIFNELNWLQYDTAIGGQVALFGNIVGSIAIVFGLWLLISMALGQKSLVLPLKR